jgi:uncharacterized protein YllA (UPF0747 family)
MNIYKELLDIEEAKERIMQSQNTILDIYEKNNPKHNSVLKETVALLEQYEELEQRFKKLSEEL